MRNQAARYEAQLAALREENERLRWVVKGAHGALTDAATVVVPGALDGDLAPAIRQITRERDEARVTKDMHKERAQEAWAEVARLEGLILEWYRNEDDEPSWVALVAEANRTPCTDAPCAARREEGRDGKV